MATVSGVWVWNDTVDESTITGDSVDFSSNSENFSYLGTATDPGMGFHIVYDNMVVYSEARKWTVAENYKTIDFGSTPQTVADVVYAYLATNATQQAEPVPTPDWANCFVKTASGNKAVEKVWIKQNGQLKVVWQPTAPAPVSFATDSWETISAACKDGSYKTVYHVGDTKDIELSTGETITVTIMGFDHDDLSDGSGKAPITVAMENLLASSYRMNASETNAGGWHESEMRTSTMATLLSKLPSDLQGVIKQVNKKATAGNQSKSITTSADKLWLLAMSEIFSATSIENSSASSIKNYADTYNAEGTQYKYYENLIGDNNGGTATNSLLIKKLSNGDGSANYWWLRSPSVSVSNGFRCFNSVGGVNTYITDNTYGVCFGFCVG